MKTLSLFFITLVLTFTGHAQNKIDYSKVIENYRSKVEKVVSSETVKGMAIALVDGNKVLWAENFGYSDFENKIKADSNTVYGIGSVSKLFTRSSIMQLR